MSSNKQKGGMYAGVNIPVKYLDIFIVFGIVLLCVLMILLSVNGGYEISFDTLGGNFVEAQRVKYGQSIKIPPEPSREGYAFQGWYSDKQYTTPFDFAKTEILSETTVYAKWERCG